MSGQFNNYINHHTKLFKYPSSPLARDSEACFCIPFKAILSTKKVWLFTRALPRSSSPAQQPVGPRLGTLASAGWAGCREPNCHHPGRSPRTDGQRVGAGAAPAFVQPRGPASESGSLGTPSLCFLPRRGPEAPPSGQSRGAWPSLSQADAALGDTCIEQRSVLLFVESPSPKLRSNVFPKWLFFLTLLLFSSSYARIKMLMAHEQLRFSYPSISPSLQMVPNDYLGNPSLEPSALTLIHTPLLAQDFKSSIRTVFIMPGLPLPTRFCYSSKKRKTFLCHLSRLLAIVPGSPISLVPNTNKTFLNGQKRD